MDVLPTGWTAERASEATSFIRKRVSEDFSTAAPVEVDELLRFGSDEGELIGITFDGGSSFPVHLEDGTEAACRIVADEIQDGVIDRLGRPWPELVGEDGGFVGVLEPQLASGIACWVLRGVAFCAVGQLSAAVPAAGLRLR